MLHYSLKRKEIDKAVKLLSQTIEKIDELPIDDQYYFISKNLSSISKLRESIELIKIEIETDAKKALKKSRDGVKATNREDENIIAKYYELRMMQNIGVAENSNSQDN